ncbi:MAG: hypothetical protein H6Q48_5270 [Deltaproteobacteria bacterium]|jgi:hypothetical protein|nr:hypothetical protein [Deltaproteobacteria bacterium]MBP1742977.1 hypothetical protein [Deltaproteobacteria bacterium]
MKKRFLSTQLLAFTAVSLFWGASLSESKELRVNITQSNGLVTLEAIEAPIEEVMDQLSREGGFRYHLFPEVKGNLISARFRNHPLQKVLKELFGDNHILKYKEDGAISAVYALDKKDRKLAHRNRRVQSYLNNSFFSLPQLKNIVSASLRRDYPAAKQFLVIPREDITGALQGYVLSFYIGSEQFPTMEGVQLEAKRVWAARRQPANQAKGAAFNDETADMSIVHPPSLDTYRSMRRSHEFITVEVSADFSSPPIKKFHKGLPDDLTMYPAAEELLAKRVGVSPEFRFIRTFVLSPMAIGFEFRDNISKQSYFVDAMKRQVFTSCGGIKMTKPRKRFDTERESRIEKQWLEIVSF